MRVMIISGEYPSEKAGGIASVVYDLGQELTVRNIEQITVCVKRFRSDTNKCVFLTETGISPFREFTFGYSFSRFVKRQEKEWDIFHFHLPNALGPLLLSPYRIRDRSIVTVHTTAEGYDRCVYRQTPGRLLNRKERIQQLGYSRFSAWMEKRSLDNAKLLVAVSSGVRDEVQQWYGKPNVLIVNNGISADRMPPRIHHKTETPRVLFVGRLGSQKGLFSGIDAMAAVRGNYEFVVVGSGPYRNILEKYSRTRNVDAHFLGYVDDNKLRQLYSSSDILLMPSLYEGFPVVGIEGAANELPIAAFRNARVEGIVCEENKGLIAETGDVGALSRTIDLLLADAEMRRRIGEKNRNNVTATLTSRAMVDQYLRAYQAVMKKASR